MTRGTSKAEVLKGDPKRTKLVESSVYDTTPVHYTSMVSEDFKWVLKENDSSNVDTVKVEFLIFLHMNYINKYNN